MKNLINHSIDLMKLLGAIIITSIYKIFNRDKIYLIGERKDQCQDNGYHLFKYVRENHKADRFYYCITKDSKQLERIKELNNIIYYKSMKHYIYYLLAEKLICAHVGSCTPDCAVVWKAEEKNIIKKKRFFIQHGITKELIPSLLCKQTQITTIDCRAKPEYQFVKKEFGYPEDEVKYLGFCRFDSLNKYKCNNQILIMPTWRKWFGMDGTDVMSEEDFIKSEYFIKYNELINSNEFNRLLIDEKLVAIFYPHNEMQRYLHLFKTKFENIIIANKENYDVQELLKESKILITDYSSIAFDFAYMKKPLIYYQFDSEEYNKKHYAKGYFDYERNGFGRVEKQYENLINCIRNIIKNNYYNEYLNKINDFFEIYDNNNCKRHYHEIING